MARRDHSLMQGVQRWFSARSFWIASGAALATPIVTTLVPDTGGWVRAGVVALVGAFALVGFAVPAARSAEAEQHLQLKDAELIEAAVTHRVALSDALLPVWSYVVNAVDPRNSTQNQVATAATLRMVLATAAHLCGSGGRIRACWYEARRLNSDNPGLYPVTHFGRGIKPSTEFHWTEPRGRALIGLLFDDTTELFPDLDTNKPANWKSTTNSASYRTFLAVPVRTDRDARPGSSGSTDLCPQPCRQVSDARPARGVTPTGREHSQLHTSCAR